MLSGARVLAEIGDDRERFADAGAMKAYAGAAPVTRASGRSHVVVARTVKNQRLASAGYMWAFAALRSEQPRATTTVGEKPENVTRPPCGIFPTNSSAASTTACRSERPTTHNARSSPVSPWSRDHWVSGIQRTQGPGRSLRTTSRSAAVRPRAWIQDWSWIPSRRTSRPGAAYQRTGESSLLAHMGWSGRSTRA